MAQTLDQARKLSRTNIHGRRLGMDHDEFMVGVKDIRKVVTNATSDTTGTALPNHGFISVVTTTNDTWVLTDPEVGVSVKLACASTSTGNHIVTPAAAVIISTNGMAGSQILMNGVGAEVELMGLSTALWYASRGGSTLATGATVDISS